MRGSFCIVRNLFRSTHLTFVEQGKIQETTNKPITFCMHYRTCQLHNQFPLCCRLSAVQHGSSLVEVQCGCLEQSNKSYQGIPDPFHRCQSKRQICKTMAQNGAFKSSREQVIAITVLPFTLPLEAKCLRHAKLRHNR